MERIITIENITYRVTFNHNEVSFTMLNITRGNTSRVRSSGLWDDWDGNVEEFDSDLNIGTNVFALARGMVPVVVEMIHEANPYFFFFSANSVHKIRAYERYARIISRSLNGRYSYQIAGNMFYFNRNN